MVRAYVPQGQPLTEKLVAFNEYDVNIAYTGKLPDNCDWAVKEREGIVISREKLLWMGEV